MAAESNDFLKEIDDLLSDTKDNGIISNNSNSVDLVKGMEKIDVQGSEDDLVPIKNPKLVYNYK